MLGLPGSVQWIRCMLPLCLLIPSKEYQHCACFIYVGESASVMQFAYRVCFPAILRNNEKYRKIPLYIIYLPITTLPH